MWVGSHVFFLAAGIAPLSQSQPSLGTLVLPLLAMTAVNFALNSGLTAIAVGLDTRRSPVEIWRRHFQGLSINYLATASLAFCLTLLIQQVGMIAMVVIIPLLVFHRRRDRRWARGRCAPPSHRRIGSTCHDRDACDGD
jgi:uncharacterized membrane protein YdbT with pleckstrin-like domain